MTVFKMSARDLALKAMLTKKYNGDKTAVESELEAIEKNENNIFEKTLNDLYELNKKNGRIGVLFSEHRKYIGFEGINYEGSIMPEDFSRSKYFLDKYANKIKIDGYKKYLMKDILYSILPEDFIYVEDEGYEDVLSYVYEGLFIKQEDVDKFDELVLKSKQHITSKDNPIEIIHIVDDNKKSSIFVNGDYLSNNLYDEHFYFREKVKIIKEVNPEYVLAELTTNLKPTKPLGAGTSAIVGKMLAGNVGAVYGYASAKQKEKEYQEKIDDYHQREFEKRQKLMTMPEYITKEKLCRPHPVQINLPIGPIVICSYEDMFVLMHKHREKDNERDNVSISNAQAQELCPIESFEL